MSKKKREKAKAAKKSIKKQGPKKTDIKKRKTQDLWKKKKWYTIVAPPGFEEKPIATTVGESDKKVIGRIIAVPLHEITGNFSHQFIKLIFRVKEIKGLTAHTETAGFEVASDYIRRNVRRRRSMVRAIKTINTKDGRVLRITAYVFTYRKISSSQKNDIGRIMDEQIAKMSEGESFENIVKKCIKSETAKDILKEVKKICPVKRVEIGKCKEVLRS